MQTISPDLIEKLIAEGHSEKEIQMYFQGLFDALTTIKVSVANSKLEMTKEETDPLYIHTWNNAIDTLSELINDINDKTFSNTNKE